MPMRVFLIHGMARTHVSMLLLARRLRSIGHRTSLFGYSVLFSDLEPTAQRFAEEVRETMKRDRAAEPGELYAVVGHSLGNIITRLASAELPPGFARFVMLAPPNHPPVMARMLAGNPFFRLLAGDAGRKLCDEAFYRALPVPQTSSLIIAGTRGPQASWLPFQGAPNDAVVRVDETRLAGVPWVTVPGVHTFLMNRGDVFALVQDFLADGVQGAAVSARLAAREAASEQPAAGVS